MHRSRARAVQVCALCAGLALGAALAGCAASRLASAPPPGVRLAGDWKLNAARSDDLGKAVELLREQGKEAQRKMRERRQAAAARAEADDEGPEPGGRAAGPGESAGEQGLGGAPMPRFSAVDELMSNVPEGDYLRISVSASAFRVVSGDSANQYTPGLASDISAQQGDAQQISGWKGAEYVIDTQPEWGPEVIQSYGVSKEGQLIVTVRLSGAGIHFAYTRVYDRTNRVAPLAPPTLN